MQLKQYGLAHLPHIPVFQRSLGCCFLECQKHVIRSPTLPTGRTSAYSHLQRMFETRKLRSRNDDNSVAEWRTRDFLVASSAPMRREAVLHRGGIVVA